MEEGVAEVAIIRGLVRGDDVLVTMYGLQEKIFCGYALGCGGAG